MIRGTDGRFKVVSWHDALAVVAEIAHQVKPEEIVGIAGKLSDAESMMALKDFLNKMGSNNVWCEGNGPSPNADLRSGYIMNCGISGLENADVFLLVGTQVIVWTFLVIYRMELLDFSCALCYFFVYDFTAINLSSVCMTS
jgi:NADH dehydrogenase (ubiquinone) Fe-S protein 1